MRQPSKGHEVVAALAAATEHHHKLREHAEHQARDHAGRFVKPELSAQPAQPAVDK